MEILEALNPQQRAAVTHVNGPLLVIAGAGSGKTRVLTYRIAYLIRECQVRPSQILAVTFTNKAAQEMQERVEKLVGSVAKGIWVSTFHSTCVRMLRVDADKIGYQKNFQIFDTADQLTVIKDCLKELNLDPKHFDPHAMLSGISSAKNQLLTPDQIDQSGFWEKQVARVYQRYQAKLKENNAFDFDDLIMQTVHLLQTNPAVREAYQERFRYILVDEYQDTNHAQYVFVNLLAQKHHNLCVVGDDDQSIYAFRGADIRNILEFEMDYPQAKVIRLEENYRSTQNILDAANHVIANNVERKGKNLYTRNGAGDKLKFHQAENERYEAAFIASVVVEQTRKHNRRYQDFTILYRTHAQSRIIEEEFVRRGIPYRIVSGLRFYDRKEIKDLLAYLRLVANPYDNYSLKRIINVPKRGIGPTTVAKIEQFASENGISMFAALNQLENIAGISDKPKKLLTNFYTMIVRWQQNQAARTVTELVETILLESGYKQELLAQQTVEAEGRIENLNEFLTVTKQFDQTGSNDLNAFLEQIALMSDVDNYDAEADVVSMMTIHAAKGLEFPVVFLVGMEDGVFPSSRSLWEPGQIEEERRLAYVGLTRAKEQLYLTCAKQRTLYGNISENPISIFVKEIPSDLIEPVDSEGMNMQGKAVAASDKVESIDPVLDLRVGDRVRHRHFGEGRVSGRSGDIVSITFSNNVTKHFSINLAPIEKIS